MRLSLFSSKQCIIKQLLDSVFVISGIIKISVSVITYLDPDYSLLAEALFLVFADGRKETFARQS